MPNTYQADICDLLLEMLKKQRVAPVGELARRLRLPAKEVIAAALKLSESGYDVGIDSNVISLVADVEEKHVRMESDKQDCVRFAIVSDTHFGSKYQQETALNRFYETIAETGIKKVFHAGDMFDGYNVYGKGPLKQIAQLFLHTYDEQIDYVIERYPKIAGVETDLIIGNHCESWITQAGADPCKTWSERRSDIHYLGGRTVTAEWNGITFKLTHPNCKGGKRPENQLYKFSENMVPSGPTFLVQGHFHNVAYIPSRSIHMIQPGAFQGTTPFAQDIGKEPARIGGFIISYSLDNDVERVTADFIRYKEIANDYTRW